MPCDAANRCSPPSDSTTSPLSLMRLCGVEAGVVWLKMTVPAPDRLVLVNEEAQKPASPAGPCCCPCHPPAAEAVPRGCADKRCWPLALHASVAALPAGVC